MPRGSADTERAPERGGGSNGVGIAVAGIAVAFFVALPFILIAVLYLFMTIYAIVRAIGPGAGANPIAVVVGFVLITSVFAILFGVTIHLVGRSITPKRSRNAD
jgi:hypothetical protein